MKRITFLLKAFILFSVIGMFPGQSMAANYDNNYDKFDNNYDRYYHRIGDVNASGFTSVDDVTALINHLLSGETTIMDDINGSQSVDVDDVLSLINYLLNGKYIFDLYYPPVPDSAMVITANGVSFAMMPVKGGVFDAQLNAYHEVPISDFHLGMTEVTYELWYAVMGDYPTQSTGYTPKPNEPIHYVSWLYCLDFISRLNELTGYQFCIPTRFMWEYAATGGQYTHGYTYAGSDDIDEVAWYKDNLPESYLNYFVRYPGYDNHSLPVGMKKPNELGLYDMSGNVWEYVFLNRPEIPEDEGGLYSVLMLGGSVREEAYLCNPFRMKYTLRAQDIHGDIGLRLALMDSTLTR